MNRSRQIVRRWRSVRTPARKRAVQRLIVTGSLPKPEAQRVREKSRKRLLRKHLATPRALRATFAGVDAVADAGAKRAAAGRVRSGVSVPSAVKFEANHAVKRAVKPAANHGTTALTAATVQDAADRNRDSNGRQRRPLDPVATTIMARLRDINRSCFL